MSVPEPMRYLSTRGECPAVDFAGTVLEGLAPDGGLYLPERWPTLLPAGPRPFVDTAVDVLAPLAAPAVDAATLRTLCQAAWSRFDHPEVAPLRPLDDELHLLELWHGPTLAFKDIALQLLGRLFDHLLSREGERRTVLGATSGDTGSAAIEGCRGLSALEVFILHPLGRTSEVQRRQMTTVLASNVHNLAVRGTFDDCQDLVKALFRDPEVRARHHLTAVNSISWARVAAQIVYYVTAASRLATPGRPVDFCVPTGNFGDVFAGWCARRMGAPIGRLIIATNTNDLLVRTLRTGRYALAGVRPTLSPSMDIQVSSNFERLLFELCGRDPDRVRACMRDLQADGAFTLPPAALADLRDGFDAVSIDDEGTLEVMHDVHRRTGRLIDPHTAVGVGAARAARRSDRATVVLSTAHAAKFPDAVLAATGQVPSLPPALADLLDRPERYAIIDADPEVVRAALSASGPPPQR